MFRSACRLAAFACVFALAPASLLAADWQVVKVSGLVWIVGTKIEPMRAVSGMILPPNATIATTAHARAMLRHGADVLSLGPDTQVAPQARAVRGLTTVLMRQGKAELDIEHRSQPHFSVETPYLAAVVKGTHFTVDVDKGDAAVSVARGRVQVTSFSTQQSVDVTNGQKATVSNTGFSVAGNGAVSPAASPAASAALVEASVGTTTETTQANGNDDTAGPISRASSVGVVGEKRRGARNSIGSSGWTGFARHAQHNSGPGNHGNHFGWSGNSGGSGSGKGKSAGGNHGGGNGGSHSGSGGNGHGGSHGNSGGNGKGKK